MKSRDPLILITSVKTAEQASKLALGLIKEKLAACVTRLPNGTSYYTWQTEIQTESEELLIIKTDQSKLESINSFICSSHPYEVPELIALSAKIENHEYLEWFYKHL
jgi:periplasmic divalent cation tolerance protein